MYKTIGRVFFDIDEDLLHNGLCTCKIIEVTNTG